jgi:hypothetical protein
MGFGATAVSDGLLKKYPGWLARRLQASIEHHKSGSRWWDQVRYFDLVKHGVKLGVPVPTEKPAA